MEVEKIRDMSLKLAMVKERLLHVETAQEDRSLTHEEVSLLKCLKAHAP